MSINRRQAIALVVAPAALINTTPEAESAAGAPADAPWGDDPRLAKLWRCGNPDCAGYTYDPLLGEERMDVAPMTAFEDLTDDFTCPECGKDKSVFFSTRDRSKT